MGSHEFTFDQKPASDVAGSSSLSAIFLEKYFTGITIHGILSMFGKTEKSSIATMELLEKCLLDSLKKVSLFYSIFSTIEF